MLTNQAPDISYECSFQYKKELQANNPDNLNLVHAYMRSSETVTKSEV